MRGMRDSGREHPRRHEDARLVEASRAGDPGAFGALFEHWFDPCVDVAWRIVHDRDAAADVAQETFLVAWRGLGSLRDPGSFGGWVLRTARNRALDRLARDRRAVPSGSLGSDDVTPAVDGPGAGGSAEDPGAAAERDENAALVWAASAALGERDASVLDLHLRHGLAVPEIAEALGVTPNNAHQLLFRLRKRLSGAIRAWVLWRDGDPACPDLTASLDAAGVTRFGADAVRVASRHVPDCEACDARQQLRLAPEALFAAIPIVPAGAVLRGRAAAALEAEGVPVAATSPAASPAGDRGSAAGDTGDGTAPGDGGPASDGTGHPGDGGGPAGDTTDGTAPGDGNAPGDGGPASDGTGPTADGGMAGDANAQHLRRGEGRRRSTRVLAAVAAALLLVAGVVALLAGRSGGDDTLDAAASERPDEPAPDESPPTMGGPAPTPTVPPTTAGATSTDEPAGSSSTEGTDPTAGEPVEQPGTPTDPPPTEEPGTEQPPPPAPAPVVLRFGASQAAAGTACGRNEVTVALVWSTEEATSATLAGPGAPAGDQPPSGSTTACAPPGQPTYTLTATGPGGTAEATATAGTPPPG